MAPTFTPPTCMIPSCTAAKRSKVPDIGHHFIPPPPESNYSANSTLKPGRSIMSQADKKRRVRDAWISIIRILLKDPRWTPRLFLDHVCSRHFKANELISVQSNHSSVCIQRLAPFTVPSMHLQSDDDDEDVESLPIIIPAVKLLKDDPMVQNALAKYMIDKYGYECAVCRQRVRTVAEVKVERVESFTRFLSWRTSMKWVGPPVPIVVPQGKKRGRPRKEGSCSCCSSCGLYVNQVWGLKLRLDVILEEARGKLTSYLIPTEDTRTGERQDSCCQTDDNNGLDLLNDRKRRRSNNDLTTGPEGDTAAELIHPIKEEFADDGLNHISDELQNESHFDDDDCTPTPIHDDNGDNDCHDNVNNKDDSHNSAVRSTIMNTTGAEKDTPTPCTDAVREDTNGSQEIAVKTEAPEKKTKTVKVQKKKITPTVKGMVLSQADKERLCKTSKAFSNMLSGKLGGKSIILIRPAGKLSTLHPQPIANLKSSTIEWNTFDKLVGAKSTVVKAESDKNKMSSSTPNNLGGITKFKLRKIKNRSTKRPVVRKSEETLNKIRKKKSRRKKSLADNTKVTEESGSTSVIEPGTEVIISPPRRKRKPWKPKPKPPGYVKPDPRPTAPKVNLSTEQKEELKQTSNLFCHHVGRNLPFKCFIDGCLKSYRTNQLLVYHQRISHFKQKPFECTVCHKRFPTFNDLRRHKILSHSSSSVKFSCSAVGCSAEFSTLRELQGHNKKVHKIQLPPTPCPVCGFSSTTRLNILNHIKKSHPFHKLIHCNKCEKNLLSNEEFGSHKCLADSKLQQRRPMNTVFANLLTNDKKKSITRVPCPECKFSFLSDEDLNSHFNSEGRCPDPNTICDICAEICPKGIFSLHMSQHYCLEGCDLTFNTLSDRNEHMTTFHTKITSSTGASSDKRSGGKSHHRRGVVWSTPTPETLRSWGRDYPFKCDFEDCQCSYNYEWEMKQHKRRYHLKERPYPCDKCNSRFFLPHLLTRHQRMTHPEEEDKVFPCDWPGCEESFTYKWLVGQHKDKDHLKIRKSFKCDQCEKTYRSKSFLRQHTSAVHTGGKNYPCSLCHQSFLYKGQAYPSKHQCLNKQVADNIVNADGAPDLLQAQPQQDDIDC